MTIDIGAMAPGERHEISVTTLPSVLTTLVGTAAAVAQSPDSDYSNNKAAAVLNVGFNSQPNSVSVVKIPINDVLFDPVSGELVVSVSADAYPGVANRVMRIDPTSGLITRSIPTPAEPGKLALSDDGTTAYALTPGSDGAIRVNLSTGEYLSTVSFAGPSGSISASDIKVLPGTVDSIIIGSGWDGVRVYDHGVVRTQTSGTYRGNLVAFLPDPQLVFAYNTAHSGFESFKFEINNTGVQTLVTTGGLFGGYTMSIKSDGYFVYGTDGKGVRADLMTIDGTFPLSTTFTSSNPIAVEPDRAGQRVYYSRSKQIAAFDSESYLKVRMKEFSNLPANIVSLERWGPDGFAARLQNNELAIIRTDLISDAPSSLDLIVSTPDNLEVIVPRLTIIGQAFSGQGISSVKVAGVPATTTNAFQNWSVDLDNLVAGENILEITATAFGNPVATRTVTHTIYYLPELDSDGDGLADSWVMEHFGRVDSPLADPDLDADGDGRSNLAEFLFGTDPRQTDASHVVMTHSADADGPFLLLEFVHRDTAATAFTVEASSDLLDWSLLSDAIGTTGNSVPTEGRPHYLTTTYRIRPAVEVTNRFYRVRADEN